jgi:BASS family bile acid:Na+ symporter
MKDPQVVQFYLSISIAIIMLGMGLSLTIADFVRITKKPKGVFIGLANQLILLPIIGFALVALLGLKSEYAVGLILIAACPGGATSNLISNLAKGDLGLSITMTAFSSIITIFTIPIIVNFSLGHYMSADGDISLAFWPTFSKMFMITIVPVAIGMFIRSKALNFANQMEKPVKVASVILMAGIIIGAVLANKDKLATAFTKVGPAIILLNVSTMLLGFFSGKLLKLELRQRVSISIECGIQNGSLALFVASLGALAVYPTILLVPAIYGTLMFLTGGIFATVYAKIVSREELELSAQS